MKEIGTEYPLRSFKYSRSDGGRSVPCEYRTYTLADREVAALVVDECGEGSKTNRLPAWAFELSARQAEVLLAALMAGDGTRYRLGYQIYYSTSRGLADDVQALAVIAGRRSNLWGPYEKGMYQVLVQEPGELVVPLRLASNMKVEDVQDRRIVCFTVPNEVLVTRREGRVAMQGNTKFAAHMVRLGLMGVELLRTGRLTLPMRSDHREYVIAIRAGQVSMQECLYEAEELENEIRALQATSELPEHPDRDRVNAWLVEAHQRHWWLGNLI